MPTLPKNDPDPADRLGRSWSSRVGAVIASGDKRRREVGGEESTDGDRARPRAAAAVGS